LSTAASKGSIKASKTVAPTLTASQKFVKGAKAGATTSGIITVADKAIKKGVEIYQGQTQDTTEIESNFQKEKGMSIEDYINKEFA
jgi:hypothetical protein